MPTVLRQDGYQFFFFADEGDEPAHIHVRKAEAVCKWWLDPVALASNHGFAEHQLTRIARITQENRALLLEAWHEWFDNE